MALSRRGLDVAQRNRLCLRIHQRARTPSFQPIFLPLVDADLELRDLGRDLGLEAEAILFEGDRLENAAAKGLVPSLHVGEVEIGHHVG